MSEGTGLPVIMQRYIIRTSVNKAIRTSSINTHKAKPTDQHKRYVHAAIRKTVRIHRHHAQTVRTHRYHTNGMYTHICTNNPNTQISHKRYIHTKSQRCTQHNGTYTSRNHTTRAQISQNCTYTITSHKRCIYVECQHLGKEPQRTLQFSTQQLGGC